MNFHYNLTALSNATSKLIFSNKNIMSKAFTDTSTEFNIKEVMICNELNLNEFEINLTKITTKIAKTIKAKIDKLGKDYYTEIIEIIISLDKLKNYLFNDSGYKGFKKYNFNSIEDNGAFQTGALDVIKYEKSEHQDNDYFKTIFSTITNLKNELLSLSILAVSVKSKSEKLEWNATSSILAELLRELELKNWIVPPKTNSETSSIKLGKLCSSIFTFVGKERSLINVLQKSIIDGTKSDKIELPHLSDLA